MLNSEHHTSKCKAQSLHEYCTNLHTKGNDVYTISNHTFIRNCCALSFCSIQARNASAIFDSDRCNPTPPKDQGATGNGTAGCPSIDYVTLLLLLTTPRTTVVQEPWGCSMEAGGMIVCLTVWGMEVWCLPLSRSFLSCEQICGESGKTPLIYQKWYQ